MAKKERDYSNLRETERLYDAVERMSTEVKDYSMEHLVETVWRASDQEISRRLVRIGFDDKYFSVNVLSLLKAINGLVEQADENGWLPRGECKVGGEGGDLVISTKIVNSEALKDHVAEVSFKGMTALIDLEELLKATRYA